MTTFLSSLTNLLAHVQPTLSTALVGYIAGNALGYAVAFAFASRPLLRRVLWPVMTLTFITPLIMLAPLLGTVFGQAMGALLLVGLSVYYSTATLVLSALDTLDEGFVRVVRGAGGTEHAVLLRAWIPASLPALAAALRAGIPAALLAAIVGDFFGAEKGLGVRLVALMQAADGAGILAFCAVCAGLAWIGLALVSLVEHTLPRRFRMSLSPAESLIRSSRLAEGSGTKSYRDALMAILVALLIWEVVAAAIDVRAYFKGPLNLAEFAFRQPTSFWKELATSGALTLMRAMGGVLAALVVATATAVIAHLWPRTRYVVLVPVLVTQTVPLVALVPLIVAFVGNGSAAIVFVSFVATFFLMFSAVDAGLRSTPRTYRRMTRLYGAGRFRHVWMVAIPYARGYIAAGVALTVPRMLAGAILAEYLVGAGGVGSMVYRYRAHEFATVWLLGLMSGLVAMQIGRQADKVVRLWSESALVEVAPQRAESSGGFA